jgi:hypothetical protein
VTDNEYTCITNAIMCPNCPKGAGRVASEKVLDAYQICGVCGGTGLKPGVQVSWGDNEWWDLAIAWATSEPSKSEGQSLTKTPHGGQ